MVGRAAVFGLLAGLIGGGAAAAELSLEFPDLRGGGKVSIAVFSDAESWKRRSQPAWAVSSPIDEGGVVRLRRDLPPGDYAVMAYHDRNANGRLDTLPVGLPTEPYGFSNDSRGVFGPPAWRAAVFRVTEAGAHQVIRLR